MNGKQKQERDALKEWFDSEHPGNPAVHLEHASTENVGGIVHQIWDVQTAQDRWWVVTNPANYYPQSDFKSRDVVLTFHVGMAVRWASGQHQPNPPMTEEATALLGDTWDLWMRAAEVMGSAEHVDDFNGVGMRLRDCLVELVKFLSDESLMPIELKTRPKDGSKEWLELYVKKMAAGSKDDEMRSYLKSLALKTWDLAQNLTHRKSATHLDAEISTIAVNHLLSVLTAALLRWMQRGGRRCGECGSFDALLGAACSRCGTDDPRPAQWEPLSDEERARRLAEPCTPASDISTYLSPDDF